ncbi:MAG: PhoH family protein [Deltaproteobacteria bacterium]|jgi:PhoH-like ATPase|nr:PhoH family protein [Deltaproteobacteria bacterium]MBW2536176.1 PhoH family protein [Deltaproteobacteria bacterium]
MKKNYVLDANVLLHDPNAIFKFEDNDVVIPIYALEEVDRFKRESTERGRSARSIARILDDLRAENGTLSKPVPLRGGGSLRIALPTKRHELLPVGLESTSLDHAILQTAIDLRDEDGANPTIFVTMDTNLRVRADALGVVSETYENPRVRDLDLERTIIELPVPRADIEHFLSEGSLAVEHEALYPNAGVLLHDEEAPNHTALARYVADDHQLVSLRVPREGVMGIRPRNKEQAVALDVLLDDSVRLVALLGKAGTGKTLLALAAGLQRTTQDHVYSRLLVSRPIMPHGRDLGYLPGDVDEKLNPWMQPIFDNLELIFASSGGRGRDKRSYVGLIESGVIEVEPLTYIRGRSLPSQYLIVDEAQNLSPHEVKTIITRSGEGTKVILTGDPHQIDHPYVDHASNGLSVVAQRFKDQALAGHIALTKGERSELAELAADRL